MAESNSDSGLVELDDFVYEHRQLSREEFLAEVRDPHLVVLNRQSTGDTARPFQTMVAGEVGNLGGSRGVLAVRKNASVFSFMITIGRATNNDLVLPDKRVSKFHGYLRKLGQQWSYTDANSSNGSTLNGVTVPAERSLNIHSGAELSLGGCNALFFLPEHLYDYIQRQR